MKIKQNIEKIGFLTILDEKGMCILDGQHRMKAIRAALEDSPEKEKLKKILQNTNEEELLNSKMELKWHLFSNLCCSRKQSNREKTLLI